ncbi:MAG: sensor histidine kinase, partial [Paracoccaceae bacterium]|nr:sensor histidine kinase [Paracoccaceae bacterium]
MLAEVLIFVPSIARFREDYLSLRLEKAQIASLALLATDGLITEDLQAELLANAEVFNVVLRRNQVRQLVLSSPMPAEIETTYDLRGARAWDLMRDALAVLVDPANHAVRVIGNPVQDAGLLIEVTLETGPLRRAMLDYGLRIFLASALISAL